MQEAIRELNEAMSNGGWLAVGGTGMMLLLKLWAGNMFQTALKRIPGVPGWLFWGNLTPFGKVIVVFATTALGTAIVSYTTGIGVGAAIGAGLTTGLAAIGTNEALKTVGESKSEGQIIPRPLASLTARDIDKKLQAPMITPSDE